MILLYIIRLWIGWLFASKLFSKPVAWLFVFLMLLDPFATFAAMQIRPDNLMMPVFSLGLLLVLWAIEKKKNVLWFFSGFVVVLSVLVSMKIATSAAVLLGFLTLSFFFQKKFLSFFWMCIGCGSAVVLFCLFFILQGSFVQMIAQLLVDAKAMSDALWFPTHLGFFYLPNNAYIFGLAGAPVTWYIALTLPVAGIGGVIYSIIRWHRLRRIRQWIVSLSLMLLLQYAFLFTVKSMFIQYYLTVNWILCFFSAVFLHAFFTGIKKPVFLSIGLTAFGFILFAFVSVESIRANIIRPTTVPKQEDDKTVLGRWSQVATDEAVYPVLLFRPLSQPIPYGYFIPEVPQSIRKKYPTDLEVMQNPRLRYLILTPYQMLFIDNKTRDYIQSHFTKEISDEELWVRNTL